MRAAGGPAVGVLPRGAGGGGRGDLPALPAAVPRRGPARGEGPHQPRARRSARPAAAQEGAGLRHIGPFNCQLLFSLKFNIIHPY